jgi:signal transduction histidine kinase
MSTAPAILIVDDTPENLEVLYATLADVGFRVAIALDGERAISQINYRAPDLILLDVMMPGIDGFETCQRLKMNPATARIPIIFITALADTEHKVKGLSLGAVDYVTKPFQRAEVLARIKIHLQLQNYAETLETQNQLLKQEIEQRLAAELALQQMQVRMVQQEKLSALGELVAGIAHEINNPINCIENNLGPAQQYITGITKILHLYQQHYPEPASEILAEVEALDLDFALRDFPKILHSMEVSSTQMHEISRSLRIFSRSDQDQKHLTDVHSRLNSTLLILNHRLKPLAGRPAIAVLKQYGTLPDLKAYSGQLGQVFMNLLANAIDALEEAIELNSLPNPQICITTEATDNQIIIKITDNGIGMTDEVRDRLFQPLFTTKAVGKGTGLGLSIAREIIVNKHAGHLLCDSTLGQGTTFTTHLPIEVPEDTDYFPAQL